jgi:hypothetical protein
LSVIKCGWDGSKNAKRLREEDKSIERAVGGEFRRTGEDIKNFIDFVVS